MPFDLDPSYKQVPDRIAELKATHPNARLRPANPDKPFEVVTIGERTFIAYAAACYRDETDTLPAIGVAWEPFPGRTPYTKDSELQNAETSAWGRAIVAALRSESKSVASAEEVRNRKADREQPAPVPPEDQVRIDYLRDEVRQMLREIPMARKPTKKAMEAAGSPEDVHALVKAAYEASRAEEDAALRGEPGELPLKPGDDVQPLLVSCPRCAVKVPTGELAEHLGIEHEGVGG